MNFLKSFGRGLLYLILSPIILAFFALYVIYLLFLFIVEWTIAIVLFFKGKKMSLELDIDKQMKDIIEKNRQAQQDATSLAPLSSTPQPQTIINNYFVAPGFNPTMMNPSQKQQAIDAQQQNLNPLGYNPDVRNIEQTTAIDANVEKEPVKEENK
jgi:hypothetical protein